MKNIREITCGTALTKTSGFLSAYTHSLQPYVGCVFRCSYCYVQALPVHQFHGGDWGAYVDVKTNLPEKLGPELMALRARGKPIRVFMSSATDPYQGAEAKYGITRQCLHAFAVTSPDLLVVQTRSPLAERDFDILRQIPRCVFSFTLETDNEAARRKLTPYAPSVKRRLETLDKAMASGLTVQVTVSPMLPNHPDRFASLLKNRCHRVLVDTYFDGDGSQGRRSERLGMREHYAASGYSDWYHPNAHRELFDAFKEQFGPERVAYSKEGFATVEALL